MHIQQVENYIQVANSEFQGIERHYFHLQFLNVERDDVEDAIVDINKDICRLQKNHPS